jgi:hypothetical protein
VRFGNGSAGEKSVYRLQASRAALIRTNPVLAPALQQPTPEFLTTALSYPWKEACGRLDAPHTPRLVSAAGNPSRPSGDWRRKRCQERAILERARLGWTTITRAA